MSLGGESSLERGETMGGNWIKIILIIGILLLPIKSFSAETVKLKYIQSVYFDEKGAGMNSPKELPVMISPFLLWEIQETIVSSGIPTKTGV